MVRGKVVDRKRGCSDPPAGVCEVIRAQTRNRLGKATGKSRSENHYRNGIGSHDGLDEAVGPNVTPRLEEPQPGKQLPPASPWEGVPARPLGPPAEADATFFNHFRDTKTGFPSSPIS